MGINIDYLVRCSNHIDTHIEKARSRFQSFGFLFHNSFINKRARVICYLLLIRPLLTYGAEILWNLGAFQAERLRSFEKTCLRTSLFLYRSESSDLQRQVSNEFLYNIANIPRIDNFMLRLARNYYAKTKFIDNDTINNFSIVDEQEAIGRVWNQ